jgi:signal transduction histidine kinase
VFLMPDGSVVQAAMKGQARQGSAAPDLEGLVRDYMAMARAYGCKEVVSDRYAAGWVRQAVERHGMKFIASEFDRSQAYLNLEPLLAQGRIELLDHSTMVRELAMLERRPRPGGKDLVEHPRGGHDDYANALALAVTYATLKKPERTAAAILPEAATAAAWWGWKYYGLAPPRTGLPLGRLPAPQPLTPSDAVLASREERARRDAAIKARARQEADELRERRAREQHDELAALVAQHGSEAVATITRRRDPSFVLPEDLRGIAPAAANDDTGS